MLRKRLICRIAEKTFYPTKKEFRLRGIEARLTWRDWVCAVEDSCKNLSFFELICVAI